MPAKSHKPRPSASPAPSTGPAPDRATRSNADIQDRIRLALAQPAKPLPDHARHEALFGADFSGVRVHAGGSVIEAVLESIQADGAAIGDDLIFRDANPDVETVAHELAHVVQADRGAGSAATSKPGDSAERDAEAAASAVARGEAPEVEATATGQVQGSFWSSVSSFAGKVVNTVESAASELFGGVDANQAEVDRPEAATAQMMGPSLDDGTTTILATGIRTDAAGATDAGEKLANALGTNVIVPANPTLGFVADLGECGVEKYLGGDLMPDALRSVPAHNIAHSALQAVKAGRTVDIYAHSQGSINTASALRLMKSDLVKTGLSEKDAEAMINAQVHVQPVGGAANKANASLWEAANSQVGMDRATGLLAASEVVEAAFGSDYPSWFTGLDEPIVDSKDLVPNATTTTDDVLVQPGTAAEKASSLIGTGTEHHSFESYITDHGDEITAHHDSVTADQSDQRQT